MNINTFKRSAAMKIIYTYENMQGKWVTPALLTILLAAMFVIAVIITN